MILRNIWPGIVVVVVLGILVFVGTTSRPAEPEKVSELRAGFEKSISLNGSVPAYASFKQQYAGVEFNMQHNAAHLFGEALYITSGVASVRVCDTDFNFGCYHGFFTKAVLAEGLTIIPSLDAACSGSSACQHGIGHGILEYMGHANLEKALQACKLTQQPDPIAGCTSGVFMEYNVPLVATGETFSVSPRPLVDVNDPFSPCEDLPEEFQQSCYHTLPQWWKQVYADDFPKMGAFCASLVSEEEEHICFVGIGNIAAPSVDYDAERTISLCRGLSSTEGTRACLTTAAWSFAVNIEDRASAAVVCEAVEPAYRKQCLDGS